MHKQISVYPGKLISACSSFLNKIQADIFVLTSVLNKVMQVQFWLTALCDGLHLIKRQTGNWQQVHTRSVSCLKLFTACVSVGVCVCRIVDDPRS